MALVELEAVLFQDQMNRVSLYNINNTSQLLTPTIFPGIKTNTSLSALAEYERRYGNFQHINGLVFPLEDLNRIINRAGTRERRFINRKTLISIPSTEMMYYKDKDFQDKVKNLGKQSFKKFYSDQSFLDRTGPKSEEFINWFQSLNPHHLALVVDTIQWERNQGARFDVPPAPPIFDSGDSLSHSLRINQIAEMLATGNSRLSETRYPLFSFFNMSPQCFADSQMTTNIADRIIDFLDISKSDAVLLKVFKERGLENNTSRLRHFKSFYEDIKNYCYTQDKLLMLADTNQIGHILMYNGLPIYSTPLNFRRDNGIPKCGFIEKERFNIWMRHYNEIVKWEDFLNYIRSNGGTIPYSTNLARHYDWNRLKDYNRMEVVRFRDKLRAEALEIDCSEWHDSIENQESRTAEIQLRNSSMGDLARILL